MWWWVLTPLWLGLAFLGALVIVWLTLAVSVMILMVIVVRYGRAERVIFTKHP